MQAMVAAGVYAGNAGDNANGNNANANQEHAGNGNNNGNGNGNNDPQPLPACLEAKLQDVAAGRSCSGRRGLQVGMEAIERLVMSCLMCGGYHETG